MLDLDIFSRFETFPLPASLILPLSPQPYSVALFLYLLFRLRAHFFARLPSLFAFACVDNATLGSQDTLTFVQRAVQ